ncbi:MAG: ribonuclease J [Pseudomonadota bacterium]
MTPGKRDLWFVPLGGCGEIGMNLNLYGHDDRWLMVDCGITFERRLGAVRPDIQTADPRFIEERRDKLAGIIITHAHEDHVGALPLLWKRFEVPVYTTPFTAEVLRRKASGRGGVVPTPIIECLPGESIDIGPFHVEWMPITHSTPDTSALLIETQAGRILHTADWKIDEQPVVGDAFQSGLFEVAGKRGLDAVICDSTNATVAGRTPSEGAVGRGLAEVIRRCEGRVVVACFASNVARMASVAAAAEETGRYLGLLGRSLRTMHSAARTAGFLRGQKRIIDSSDLGYLPRDEVLVLATGSQGEFGAALHRLSAGTHPDLELTAGDTVILSARVIPGNEEPVENLLKRFRALGVSVVQDGDNDQLVHASGHPCADELAAMYRWLSPRLVVPVHGEKRHMEANAKIAKANGALMALTGGNGDLFYLAPEAGVRRRFATAGRLQQDENGHLQPLIE